MTSASRPRLARLASTSLLASVLFAGARPAISQICAGDCNSDGEVRLGEVQTSFNIFLGTASLAECPTLDADGDLEVTLGDVQVSFNQFLGSCTAPAEPLEGTEAVEGAARAAVSAVDSFGVISFGSLGQGGGGAIAGSSARLGIATAARGAIAAGTIARAGGGAVLEPCALLGRRDIQCVADGNGATRTVDFQDCRENAGDNLRIRDGKISQTVDVPGFCDDLVIPPGAIVTLDLENFTETILTANEQLVRRTRATLTNRFEPSGIPGCMGPNGAETIDGRLDFECAPELDPDCAPAISDLTLRPRMLHLERSSPVEEGAPCVLEVVATGGLGVENAMLSERFDQTFDGFQIEQRLAPDETMLFTERGRMRVDCIGEIDVGAVRNRPLRLVSIGRCPVSGELRVSLLDEDSARVRSSATLGLAAGEVGGGAAVSVTNGLTEYGYRSASGNVYQILQNPNGEPDLGIDDFRITTLVGSADGLARCDTSGAVASAVVTAADGGAAFPIASVVRSPLVPLATEPCFNPNAGGGAGAVCIGAGCRLDCSCETECFGFTIDDGVRVDQGSAGISAFVPVESLGGVAGACKGANGLETYAIGAASPTTGIPQCDPAPSDGVALAAGASLVVAYRAPFARPFSSGAAGFGVDRDASTDCDAEGAVVTGAATRNDLPAPLVRFAESQAVEFDVNGDDFVDRAVDHCLDLKLERCGLPAPTATPTPIVQPACPQLDLDGIEPLTQGDSTEGRPNQLGGASCGDGGNESAEQAYGYVAPADGFYTIDTIAGGDLETGFDTLLYVRDTRPGDRTCSGPELACSDNVGLGELASSVNLFLEEGQEVVIVVDGSGGGQGDFVLTISRADEPPPPTETPTPRIDRPDLAISAVNGPATGTIGEQIEVSAEVENVGDADSPESQLEFVFAADPELEKALTPSGARCRISSLEPGGNDICTLSIPVPAALLDGTYFVGVIADAEDEVQESDETNNRASTQISLTGGRPCGLDPGVVPPVCSGSCPPDTSCVSADGACGCIPVTELTPSPTPTVTPTPTVRKCGGFGRCGGACPSGQVCTSLGSTCTCLRFFPLPPTPTPTRPPCGSTFPKCNGSCSANSFCFERSIGCACFPRLPF